MYPLNMKNADLGGYAVANDEKEHKALSDAGYEPKLVETKAASTEGDSDSSKPSDGLNVAQLKEALAAKGVEVPEGAKKADLAALLDAAE